MLTGLSIILFGVPPIKDVEGTARSFLDERYGVREVDKHELAERFRKLGLWDAILVRFNELFPPNANSSPFTQKGRLVRFLLICVASPYIAIDGSAELLAGFAQIDD